MALAVYHERQEAALCGMHCLNNLVQAPTFDVSQLMEIAQGLDSLVQNTLQNHPPMIYDVHSTALSRSSLLTFLFDKERQAMAEGGMSQEFLEVNPPLSNYMHPARQLRETASARAQRVQLHRPLFTFACCSRPATVCKPGVKQYQCRR